MAKAKRQITTLTKGVQSYKFPGIGGGIRLIDTAGLNDPQNSNNDLYSEILVNLLSPAADNAKEIDQHCILEEGINCIVSPIMIPRAQRLMKTDIDVIFNIVMMFQMHS